LPQEHCDFRIDELAVNGETLTYDRALKLEQKSIVAANGTVALSPVDLPNGRQARIEIDRQGCARLAAVLGVR
jgi:hypothetical protein